MTAGEGPPQPSRVLFLRNLKRFTGGQLKVWHYFNHVRHSPRHVPQVYFCEGTVWTAENPWWAERDRVLRSWSLASADILFLAGLDWLMLAEPERERPALPIINLIQHVRHGDPADPRFAFLRHRAIRICVSDDVAEALRASRRVNGPLFVIPNGLDIEALPPGAPLKERPVDVLIVGMKEPALARRLYRRLRMRLAARLLWRRVEMLSSQVPRPVLLEHVSRAKVTLFLPNRTEGFYLPALEGMAVGTLVVCPDCVGNRSFCLPDANCLRPAYAEEEILRAVEHACRLGPEGRATLVANAKATASKHSLESERRAFLGLLDATPAVWREREDGAPRRR